MGHEWVEPRKPLIRPAKTHRRRPKAEPACDNAITTAACITLAAVFAMAGAVAWRRGR